jgi:MFS family permease
MKNTNESLPKHFKWNMTMGVFHGVSFSFAMAFSEPFSVLPIFLESFGISRTMIGLLISIIKSGSALPQILVANRLRRRRSGKKILFGALVGRWLAWGLIAAVVFMWGDSAHTTVLIFFVLLLFLFSFAGGVANVPFFNMIAKAIPADKRGRFFGLRQFWGGIAAAGAGWLVRWLLALPSIPFPQNYGYLFLITFIVLTFGYIALILFREPEHEEMTISEEKQVKQESILAYLKKFPSLRNMLMSQITGNSLLISMPFFVLYAKDELGFPVAWVGYFVMAQMLGGVVSNFLWSRLSDRFGNRIVIRLSILTALLALIFALIGHSFIVYVLVFVFAGFYFNGAGIGFHNYIMELGSEKERPRLISIQGTLMFPVYFFPLLGGFLVDYFGFTVTFVFTALVLLLGVLLSLRLCEPRDGHEKCLIIPSREV